MCETPGDGDGNVSVERQTKAATAATASDLERLLATERRLEQLVHRVREEAADLEARTRDAAARRTRTAAAELATAVRDLETRLERETVAAAEEIGARALAAAAAFRDTPPERVAALADRVVTELLDWTRGSGA